MDSSLAILYPTLSFMIRSSFLPLFAAALFMFKDYYSTSSWSYLNKSISFTFFS